VDKPIVWLVEHVRTPPLGEAARSAVGFLLRRIQRGEHLAMPLSRPMPSIGSRVHELRVNDAGRAWRVTYRIDPDAIVLVEWFEKKTLATPRHALALARRRLAEYDREENMDAKKRKRLAAKGWKVGTVQEALGLADEEMALVEMKLALSDAIRSLRDRKKVTQA